MAWSNLAHCCVIIPVTRCEAVESLVTRPDVDFDFDFHGVQADFEKPQCKMGRQLSAALLAEAGKFKVDIDAAVARSVVKFSPEAAKTYGAEMFVPSAVVPDGKPPLVFQSMTQDTLSEYSNVRELTTNACCRQLFSVFMRWLLHL